MDKAKTKPIEPLLFKKIRPYASKKEALIVIKRVPGMGRGIFADRSIRKGQTICKTPILSFSKHDETLLQHTNLRYYVFNGDADNSVLALGTASLFNHSFDPNATYSTIDDFIVVKAAKTITKGEQIFINYGYDPVNDPRVVVGAEPTRKSRMSDK